MWEKNIFPKNFLSPGQIKTLKSGNISFLKDFISKQHCCGTVIGYIYMYGDRGMLLGKGTGYRIQDTGAWYRVKGKGYRVHDTGYRVQFLHTNTIFFIYIFSRPGQSQGLIYKHICN